MCYQVVVNKLKFGGRWAGSPISRIFTVNGPCGSRIARSPARRLFGQEYMGPSNETSAAIRVILRGLGSLNLCPSAAVERRCRRYLSPPAPKPAPKIREGGRAQQILRAHVALLALGCS
jgi:hypothetical protein